MSSIEIVPVQTRKQKSQFLGLPWTLYRGNPNWVPPLRMNQKELVNFKSHPFYDDADIQTFLALQQGQPVGRVAAIDYHGHNRHHPDEQRGFVGFFESIDNQEVANGLFDAACDWFRPRNLFQLRGPANPSMNYECGLLVKNFDMPPTFMMTYNHDYYPALWENYGFVKAQDMLTFTGKKSDLETMKQKIVFVANGAMERFGIKVRGVNTKDFIADVMLFLDIYNRSLEANGNWGHVPMTDAEVRHTAASLRHLIVPSLTLIAEIDGKPVGSMLGLLDYNPLIRKIDGRLFDEISLLRDCVGLAKKRKRLKSGRPASCRQPCTWFGRCLRGKPISASRGASSDQVLRSIHGCPTSAMGRSGRTRSGPCRFEVRRR